MSECDAVATFILVLFLLFFFSFCPLLGCRALLRVHVDDLFRITYGVYHQKIKQLVGVFFFVERTACAPNDV